MSESNDDENDILIEKGEVKIDEENMEKKEEEEYEENEEVKNFENKMKEEDEKKKKQDLEKEKKVMDEERKKKEEKLKEFKKYTKLSVPFYGEDFEGVYDLNIPYGFFDIKIKNEDDKQENYFNLQRIKLTINY